MHANILVVLLWTPSHGQAKAGRPARTYIQQLCEDTEFSPEDLLEVMNDGEGWRERVRDIRAGGTTDDKMMMNTNQLLISVSIHFLRSLLTPTVTLGFHRGLSYCKSLFDYSTLLSILVNFENTIL